MTGPMSVASRNFSRDAYRSLLKAFQAKGYQIVGYEDAEADKKHLVLRHDLDMSLQAAEPIAEIEADLEIRAHYFVLVRTEMYNPFSEAARNSLAKIRAYGHEIGLHLDASLYGDDPASLQDAADWECRALEDATGTAVRFISFHRPAEALLGYEERLAGRSHAYEPRFFNSIGYCSDSRGDWHHGHPLEHPSVLADRAIQLLTHPIWWTDVELTVQRNLEKFLAARYKLLRRELGRNCQSFDPSGAPEMMARILDEEENQT